MLVFSLLILLGLTSLVGVGLTRSLTEVSAGNRLAATQQAFYSAEAGVDWLVRMMDPASGCFTSRIDQANFLSDLNEVTAPTSITSASFPDLPTASDCQPPTTASINFAACGPNLAATDEELFPICLQGTANNTTQSIHTVVELTPSGGITPAGAMALSKIKLGEGTEVRGDVILLSHGDQEESLKVGKGAKIAPAEDGSGGRVFIRDYPNVDLDLSQTGNADNLLPAIKKADGTLGGPVLTGIGDSRPWPIIPNGDDVKDAKAAFLADLTASGGKWVKESTLREFVKSYITVPDEKVDIFNKMQVLNKALTKKQLDDLDRFTRVRTKPNWNNEEQVPRITITVGGISYPDVNNGDWRITQGTGQHATQIRLFNDTTGKEVYPDGPLPGGVWMLKSVDVPKYAPPLTFQGSTRLYLTGHNNIDDEAQALKLGEGTSIRVGEAAEPHPDDLQIIVPCSGRAGGDNICKKLDEFGVCQDTEDNPDEQACAIQNTAALHLGKGSTVWGSIHTPTTEVKLGENVLVKGDYVVSDELYVGKGAELHSPTGFSGPGGGASNEAKEVTIKLWQGR